MYPFKTRPTPSRRALYVSLKDPLPMKKTIKGYIGENLKMFIDIGIKSTDQPIFLNELKAFVDTGAYPCLISKKTASKLNLGPFKYDEFNSVFNGMVKTLVFKIDISLDGIIFKNIECSLLPEENPPFDILLGMTFLKDFDITYQGRKNIFEVSFDFD